MLASAVLFVLTYTLITRLGSDTFMSIIETVAHQLDTCGQYPHLHLEAVVHNNLGHRGPDGGPEGMVYRASYRSPYAPPRSVLLNIHAVTPYNAWTDPNGLSGEQGMLAKDHSFRERCLFGLCRRADQFGTIVVSHGRSVTLKLHVTAAAAPHGQLDLPYCAFTWFDLDRDRKSESTEAITASNFNSFHLSRASEVHHSQQAGGVTFRATKFGNGKNNPVNAKLLTTQQMNRAVTLVYTNMKEVFVTLSSTAGGTAPRIFMFDAIPSIQCAMTVPDSPATLALAVAFCVGLVVFVGTVFAQAASRVHFPVDLPLEEGFAPAVNLRGGLPSEDAVMCPCACCLPCLVPCCVGRVVVASSIGAVSILAALLTSIVAILAAAASGAITFGAAAVAAIFGALAALAAAVVARVTSWLASMTLLQKTSAGIVGAVTALMAVLVATGAFARLTSIGISTPVVLIATLGTMIVAAVVTGILAVIASKRCWCSKYCPGLCPPEESQPGKIAVLGDISGSMHKERMICLKKSFHDLLLKAEAEEHSVILGAWDSWVDFPEPGEDRSSWIDALVARGGNDMRFAIEHTMERYPEITELYIMTDGDVSPFGIPGKDDVDVYESLEKPEYVFDESKDKAYSDTDWESFRDRFKEVRFHFIALGKDADQDKLETMAIHSGGTFAVCALDERGNDGLNPQERVPVRRVSFQEGFASLVNFGHTGLIAVLGDISNSMNDDDGEGMTGLKCLKKSFSDLIDKANDEQRPILLGAWNTKTAFYKVTGVEDGAKRWVSRLRAAGKTEMRQAIESGMHKNGDVRDMYIMTDGKVELRAETWRAIRKGHPLTRFHFIALGPFADRVALEEMAAIGHGTFSVVDHDAGI